MRDHALARLTSYLLLFFVSSATWLVYAPFCSGSLYNVRATNPVASPWHHKCCLQSAYWLSWLWAAEMTPFEDRGNLF